MEVNPVALRICAWSGVIFTVLLLVSFAAVLQFIPAPSAAASARDIAAMFSHHAVRIRFGIALYVCAVPFILPFGVALAAKCAQGERGFPIFAAVGLASTSVAVFAGLVGGLIWGAAAFRPDAVPASTTRMLNDFGWIAFLLTWSPFAIWNASIALTVFFDTRVTPVFPPWVAYFNLWLIFLYAPAGLMLFFKHGPFAFNGVFALWVPGAAFVSWLAVMIVMLLRGSKDPAEASARGG